MFDHRIVLDYWAHIEREDVRGATAICQDLGEGIIFVVGCPRSGTTLLGNALAQAEWAVGGEEFLFMLDMYRIYSGLYKNKSGPKVDTNIKSYISEDEILTQIGRFCDSLYRSMRGTRNIIDHTPFNVNIIGFIRRILPQSRFVHIIRNGRDVEASLRISFDKGYTWAGRDTPSRARRWVSTIETVMIEQMRAPIGAIVEVRYEELCADPQEELKRVSLSLGVPFDIEMLSAFEVPHAEPSRRLILPRSDKLDFCRTRSILDPTEEKAFQIIAGTMMAKLGY